MKLNQATLYPFQVYYYQKDRQIFFCNGQQYNTTFASIQSTRCIHKSDWKLLHLEGREGVMHYFNCITKSKSFHPHEPKILYETLAYTWSSVRTAGK